MSKTPSRYAAIAGYTIKIIPAIMAIIPIISFLVLEFMDIIMYSQLYIFNEKIYF